MHIIFVKCKTTINCQIILNICDKQFIILCIINLFTTLLVKIFNFQVRPGTQTVAVATQTMVSSAVTINSNTPTIRTQVSSSSYLLFNFSSVLFAFIVRLMC